MRSLKVPGQKSISKSVSASACGKKRLWLFRLIALFGLPLLLLAALECGLRLCGYGYPTQAIVKHTLREKQVYCHNYQFGWRFFPRNAARNFDGFVFDIKKPQKTYRIFILGESAAMGMPAPAYNFGRILEVMLDDMYPQVNFEVHTAAMVAINSHAVLSIAKDCAQYQPDLFIVYMGNNEVVGPFGPASVFAPVSPSLSLIRANLAVKSTRTGQLLETIVGHAMPADPAPQRWGGLEMFLDKQVRHDNPALESVYKYFEINLLDICQTAKRCGASIVVSNIGCNLRDCPPFASLHRGNLTDSEKELWEEFYQQGVDCEVACKYSDAIEQYFSAAQIDNTFADLQYRIGRCFWLTGDFTRAKEHYVNALEYDALRFRADKRINEIIRSVASGREKERIYFADSVKAFKERSSNQIPGMELFYEHVHFNFEGNYCLAQSMLPHIQKVLPADLQQSTQTVLTSQQAADFLAYTNFERHDYVSKLYNKMLNAPPFTNQLYHDEFMLTVKQQIDNLAGSLQGQGLTDCLTQHQSALRQRPDDWQLLYQYAIFSARALNNYSQEETLLKKVIERCPYDSAYLNLAKDMHRKGEIRQAIDLLTALLKLNPAAGRAHVELASIYQATRDNRKYIEHLSKSLLIDSASSIEPYGALANAYEKAGRPGKAVEVLERAVSIFPENQTAAAHASMGCILNGQGKYEKALEEMTIALKINPDFGNDALFQSLLRSLQVKVNQ